jgi:AcrR family transcriptional regulator
MNTQIAMNPTAKAPPPRKEEIFKAVLSAAMKLDFKYGHLRWTMSQLARESGISRSLIYYYFGTSKLDLLMEAVKLLGDDLAGFSSEKQEAWQRGDVFGAIRLSRRLLDQFPGMIAFYYTHSEDRSELGELIREIEKKHLDQLLHQFFPWADEATVQGIFALLLGVSYAPLVTDAGVKAGVEIVLAGLTKLRPV